MSKKPLLRLAPCIVAAVMIGASLACEIPDPIFYPFYESEQRQTEEASMFETERAETHATQTARASEATLPVELTAVDDMSEEEVEATWGVEEACIVQEGTAYDWEYTDFKLEEGTRGTQCLYKFTVRNTSDEDQHLILYERWNNKGDTGGQEWEGWNVRQFSAHDSYEYNFSYTKFDDGQDTWNYAAKLLIVRGISECYWLTRSDDPKNMDLWEEYAILLENPCW